MHVMTELPRRSVPALPCRRAPQEERVLAARVAPVASTVPWRSAAVAGLAALAMAGLVGCAGQTTSSVVASPTGGSADVRPTTPRTDLATASDVTDIEKRARIRLELAAEYFAQGRSAVALDEVKQALVADPNLPQAYNLRGLIYAGMSEFDLAEDSFRRALALNARDADTLHNYGWYLCQRSRHAESVALFERALAVPQYRDRARTLLAQGVCDARAGDLAGAEKTLQKAYELDPSNPATAVNLADVLYRRGEYERARFYVKRVNATEQLSNAETLWLAARIENKLGNRQGVDEFGKSLKERFPRSREASRFDLRRFDD
jgi:type IV pilus assembly protein PilF